MTSPAGQPPRLLAGGTLPAYAHLPGVTPHPVRDPAGHSHGLDEPDPPPPDPTCWRDSRAYLRGIDLFNHGYFWEAHEAWECLWNACGRTGRTALFLKGLIALAAAGLKRRGKAPSGARHHAARARGLFLQADLASAGTFMGISLADLHRVADKFEYEGARADHLSLCPIDD